MGLYRLAGQGVQAARFQNGAKVVLFGDAVAAVLRAIPELPDNPWVITGTKDGARLTDLQPPWRRIRRRAGLNDVRIHDLRHSFASAALFLGEGLPMIGKLLGHTQVQTGARYAHLALDPVRNAAEKVFDFIAKQAAGSSRFRDTRRNWFRITRRNATARYSGS